MKLSFKTLLQLTALLALATGTGRSVAGDHDAVLDWSGLHIVSFPLDGGVTSVHVRAGDRVARGDKLVELNTEPIEIRIDQYEAELAARKPVLADAKRDFEHAKSLYEQTVLSDVELQMDGPGLLVMVPRAALDPLMQVFLSGQTGRWPARAGSKRPSGG